MSFMDGDPVNTNYAYNQDGTASGFGFGFGSMQSPWLQSPGQMNPYSDNPYVSQDLFGMQQLQKQSGQIMDEAFDPTYYNGLKANALLGQTTGIDNSYAKMGLAGSSANLGADESATNQTNMQFYNRQMGDQRSALQGMMGTYQAGLNGVMGVQGQQEGFQNDMLSVLMGLNNSSMQQQAGNEQMVGSMVGGLGSAGGSYMGMKGMMAMGGA